MPTKGKKARLDAKRAAKKARLFDAKQLTRLQSGAYRVYGCACAWCQWREYNIIARRPDPGPGAGPFEAPPECKESTTVKLRAAVQLG